MDARCRHLGKGIFGGSGLFYVMVPPLSKTRKGGLCTPPRELGKTRKDRPFMTI